MSWLRATTWWSLGRGRRDWSPPPERRPWARKLRSWSGTSSGATPQYSVIRAYRVFAEFRLARAFGVPVPESAEVDFPAVRERMRHIRARISHHDSAERFRQSGVDVFLGAGRFAGPDSVEVVGKRLRFQKAVIATGTRTAVPPIPGLKEAGYLTNETVFNLTERPGRLLVLGGGPLGCELAQAFCRLGSQVKIVEMAPQFLIRGDPEAARILARAFEWDGIEVRLNTQLRRVVSSGEGKRVYQESDGQEMVVEADTILVGVGRAPNMEGLGLEAARVRHDGKRGIHVNDRLQTTNPCIYAAGDACLTGSRTPQTPQRGL